MKLTYSLAALALTLGAASAQTLLPFKDPAAKLPFSFSYPQGWLGVELGDKALGVSMVSAKTPPASMIRLLYAPLAGTSPNLTAQANDFQNGLGGDGLKVAKQSSYLTTYGGQRGLEREYLISKGQKVIKMRVWLTTYKKNIYSFQVTDSQARYPAASALFTRLMSTVKFR